jgi:hypothetical protein
MEWQLITALAVMTTVILFPAAFVWYVNLGGIIRTILDLKTASGEKSDVAAG